MGSFLNPATAFNMVNSFLNPQEGYKAAGNDVENYWNQGKKYLEPYQNAGTNQIDTLTNAQGQLMHPEEFLNNLISSYHESPYAKQLTSQATDSGLTSASQQGLLGSSAALNNIEKTSSNIMESDRNNYLDQLMQKYFAGLNIGTNIFNTGANVGNSLFQGSLNTGNNMAQADYGVKNAPGELFQKILGTAAGAYAGGMA